MELITCLHTLLCMPGTEQNKKKYGHIGLKFEYRVIIFVNDPNDDYRVNTKYRVLYTHE